MSTAHFPTPDYLFYPPVIDRNLHRGRTKIERIFSRLKLLRRLWQHSRQLSANGAVCIQPSAQGEPSGRAY